MGVRSGGTSLGRGEASRLVGVDSWKGQLGEGRGVDGGRRQPVAWAAMPCGGCGVS